MASAVAGGDRRLRRSSSPRCTAGVAPRRRRGSATTSSSTTPPTRPVDLAGTSVQYRSATGTANPSGVTALSGTIPAKGYFLVGEGTGTAGAPVPDARRERVDQPERHGRHDLPGQPDHGPDRSADRLAHRQPGRARRRRLRHQQHLRDRPPPRPRRRRPRSQRDAAGTDTDDNASDFTVAAGHARRRAGRWSDGPADRSAHGPTRDEDHRGDPGHRRHQPARRQERSPPRAW